MIGSGGTVGRIVYQLPFPRPTAFSSQTQRNARFPQAFSLLATRQTLDGLALGCSFMRSIVPDGKRSVQDAASTAISCGYQQHGKGGAGKAARTTPGLDWLWPEMIALQGEG